MEYQNTRDYARMCDQEDPLSSFRNRFHLPLDANGQPAVYFAGNSLGLQPKTAAEYVLIELEDWRKLGVEGHVHARHPWMRYHELVAGQSAELVGGLPHEVVVMNSLTVNLHLLMVSFYRPTNSRHKILIEADAFPSDKYAVASQARFHGYDPAESIIELQARPGEASLRTEDILETIRSHGNEIATILVGGVNYYTGQYFDLQAITAEGHNAGCVVGFDLAHAIGNVEIQLHDWDVDFAAWCSYKYLNSGPGGIAGVFVNERHSNDSSLPRFNGWWGHDKETRFAMPDTFKPVGTAEAWQLSNPPILQLASLRASLDMFEEAGFGRLIDKSRKLTGYLEWLVKQIEGVESITPGSPADRGCQLSLRVDGDGRDVFSRLTGSGVICDWREPDVIRVAPVPLYNSFEDVYRFATELKRSMMEAV
ncbi:MAG: kynureninase [Rhodothermales bacterium]|nr:kynureninase [Rhodothermales bacterium]